VVAEEALEGGGKLLLLRLTLVKLLCIMSLYLELRGLPSWGPEACWMTCAFPASY
jgi:hypothetical protein